MRVSTNQMHFQSVNAMLEQQSKLSQTQLQIASGRRILTPADDPSGAKQILDLNQVISSSQQHQRNADAAESSLHLEESALQGVVNVLQRVRELAVQGNNATLSDQDRSSVALEVRQKLQELLGLANSQDSNGEYLFAGYKTDTQPFAQAAVNVVTYSGDDGQKYLQIGPGRRVAVGDSGTAVFRAIKNGNGTFATSHNPINSGSGVIVPGTVTDASTWQANRDSYTIRFTSPTTYEVVDGAATPSMVASGTYQSGQAISFQGVQVAISGTPALGDTFTVAPSANQDIFTTVQNLADALETPANDAKTRADLNNNMNRVLTDLDQSLDSIVKTEANIGARLNAIDSQRAVNDDVILQSQQILSATSDLDIAEATTRLNKQLVSLQAAQQTYIRVQGLSLFNYLR
jgi:flagellar hook-associated protein 3 FlgL